MPTAEVTRRYRQSPRGRLTTAAYNAAYRATEAGRARVKAGKLAYEERNPLKVKARNRVRDAVFKRRLVRLACEIWACGDPDTQAHHAFGYAGDMALAVWWLCRYHHARMHRAV